MIEGAILFVILIKILMRTIPFFRKKIRLINYYIWVIAELGLVTSLSVIESIIGDRDKRNNSIKAMGWMMQAAILISLTTTCCIMIFNQLLSNYRFIRLRMT